MCGADGGEGSDVPCLGILVSVVAVWFMEASPGRALIAPC